MAKNLNLGNVLTSSRSNISKLEIFLKNRFHSNWRSYLVLTSGQKPKKIVRADFDKNISVWFWANFETFSRISLNQEFFSKICLCDFSTFTVPTSSKKSEKSLESFLRKLRYQPTNQPTNQKTNQPTKQPTNQTTNQPTNYCQQRRFYGTWLTSFRKGEVLPVCKWK